MNQLIMSGERFATQFETDEEFSATGDLYISDINENAVAEVETFVEIKEKKKDYKIYGGR